MKNLLFIVAALFLSDAGYCQPIKVDQATTMTVGGIGGYADIAYAFAKGDKIVIKATAAKPLKAMVIVLYPDKELGKVRSTKNIDYAFSVPEEGIVTIRFISDRGGSNKVNYFISREAETEATRQYDTKVIWEKQTNIKNSPAVPKRAGQ